MDAQAADRSISSGIRGGDPDQHIEAALQTRVRAAPRDFARSASGRPGRKTDAIDASVIAHFGEALKPPLRPLRDRASRELSALVARRLTANRDVDPLKKNRLASADSTAVKRDLKDRDRLHRAKD